MTDIAMSAQQRPRTINLKKYGAIAAIAFPALQMISQGLIQVGGMEPAFTAPASEILAFFENRNLSLFEIGSYLSMVSTVAFLWFLGVFWDELRTAEGGSGWLSLVALGSGLVTVALILGEGGWYLAVFRLGDGVNAEMARLLFDQGNLNFAQMWVALGSMVLAAGLVMGYSSRFPRWLGWASILLAIGLILARAVWTTPIAFAPYVLFWVWMIVIGVMLLRQYRGTTNQ